MQRTLLLVDDENGITDAITRMLRAEPLHILQASNGAEALQLLHKHEVHLLITDYKMPGIDGLELCRQVRACSPATYRLLLSGQVDYSVLRQAWQNGEVHRFVAKPWDNLLLLLDIHEGLRQQQLLQQSNQLLDQLRQQQALLLTDENWVVKFVNEPLCHLLNCRAEDILGNNLFSSTLSATAVALETDITRQTEQQQSWLGNFRFHLGNHSLTTRMSINPLGSQFRLCLCEAITEPQAPERGLQEELERYNKPKLQPASQQTAVVTEPTARTAAEASSPAPATSTNTSDKQTLTVQPLFNPAGQLVALQLPTAQWWQQQDGEAWLQELQQQWQQHIRQPLQLLFQASPLAYAQGLPLLQYIQQHQPGGQPIHWFAIISEEDLLSDHSAIRQQREQLLQAGCQLLLAGFGPGFLSPRQLLNLPLAGLLLDPHWLQQLHQHKYPQQHRRLLQRLRQYPLLLCTTGIDTPDILATAHQSQLDWLSGNLLSAAIQPQQLRWFASTAESGA